ncbi:MAG: hypothetical protein ACM3X6_06550 [Patescibacteria group bacterium]
MTDPLHWRLYQRATHLKEQIGLADYEVIFDAIWQDRAEEAGWRLEIARRPAGS